MIYFRIALLICTLLPALISKGQQQRDSVLDRIISVNADNLPVTVILDQITRENGIFFSYDAMLINNERRISVHFDNLTIREILQSVFKNEGYHFLGKSNHIIISDREELPPVAISPPDSVIVQPMIVLTGKVLDQSKREPISNVTISLLNKPVGTITNTDGNFILKLPAENVADTVIISNVGYARQKMVAGEMQKDQVILLQSISIKIKEIKVRAISAAEILANIRKNISANYSTVNQLLTGFYRETLKQDNEYINISEAVLEILKAPYDISVRDDKVHLLKARRSREVQPFQWVNFKLQGGPYMITMLDVVKKMETFLDPEYEILYRYTVQEVIWYKNHPVFVIRFRPVKDIETPCFVGEMYIDRESYALLYARFSLNDYGLGIAEQSLIMKKPKGFKVKPQFVDYQVDFSEYNGKWHLHTAQASVAFKVRSPKDKINSIFHSVSDLLITDVSNTELKRFPVKDLFTAKDVFAEIAINYDADFWGNYNIIQPNEDLQDAIKKFTPAQNLETHDPATK